MQLSFPYQQKENIAYLELVELDNLYGAILYVLSPKL